MKKRILIGHVEFINLNGVAKCGGAVVKEKKTNLVANLVNMNTKMMKTTWRMAPNKPRNKSLSRCVRFAACVATRLVTVLRTA